MGVRGLWMLGACLLGLLSACDDGKVVSARQKHCEAICDKLEMCDDATDVTGCQAECQAQDFRSERYFQARDDCAVRLSCNRLVGPADLDDCVGDALREDEPPPQVAEICRGLSNLLSNCDQSVDRDQVRSDCDDVVITLSPEYLDASDQCTREVCAEMSDCFDDLADAYDTDVKLY